MGFLHQGDHLGVLLVEQASDPATPAANRWLPYAKSDGLYVIDDTGAVKKLLATGDVDLSTTVILAPTTDARNRIQSAAEAVTLTLKRRTAGATSDLFQAQDETGVLLAAIDKSGVVVAPIYAPLADGTTAIRITKANKTTDVVRIDTTNSRVGIGVTPSYVLDVSGNASTARIYDQTPTTGSTRLYIRAGAGQSGNVLTVINNAETLTLLGISTTGITAGVGLLELASNNWSIPTNGAIQVYSGGSFRFGSGNAVSAADISLARNAAGVLELNSGTAGVFRDLKLRHLTFDEAGNVAVGTTTGTKIGTVGGASGQKLAFWASTPIVQPVLATGAGRTVDEVITVLQNLGLVRQS